MSGQRAYLVPRRGDELYSTKNNLCRQAEKNADDLLLQYRAISTNGMFGSNFVT